jgi:transcriptional regulator with XRE-family HTH domain
MKTNHRPFFGSASNPPLGLWQNYTDNAMNGGRKRSKIAGTMRLKLASNVRARMELQYRDEPNKPKRLANDASVSLSTVQRILAGEVGASLDNIEALSKTLGVDIVDLLGGVGKITTGNGGETRQRQAATFDRELLREVFVVLEKGLERHPIGPAKKMQALEMAYDISKPVGRVDRIAVERVLKLVITTKPDEARRVRKGSS